MREGCPETVEEFIKSKWFKKIKTTIVRFRLREDPEDTMQDILLSLYKKDYLQRWDISKGGNFATWLYKFVHNMLYQKWNRSHTRGGRAIEGAISLFATSGKSDSGEIPLVCMLPTRHLSVFDFNIKIAEVDSILSHSKYKANSSFTWAHGVTYDRDMRTVFSLIACEGLGASEIAHLFNTSRTFVQQLIVKIRPIVQQVFDVKK